MSLICRQALALAALLATAPAGAAGGLAAQEQLGMEARADGKCQNLSEGGKLIVLRSTSDRPISYRLVRYFADVPQTPTVGRITPDEPEQPLGCNRVDGRVQRWVIKRASFEEVKTP